MSINEQDDSTSKVIDILHRGLIKLSMISEGQDETLDQHLQELRKALKKQQLNAVDVLINTLSEYVVDLEKSQSSDAAQIRAVFRELASDWLTFSLDKKLQQYISDYLAGLPAQFFSASDFLPALQSLQDIQSAALQQLQQDQQSILGRLFSKKQLPPTQDPVYIDVFDEKKTSVDFDYAELLSGLIDALKPYYPDEEQFLLARKRFAEKRIQDSVSLIQQFSGCVQYVFQNSSSSFTQYLDGVSRELGELNRWLQHNKGVDDIHEKRRQDWHQTFHQTMAQFEAEAANSSSVDALKNCVQQQIAHLRSSLSDLRQVDKDQQQLSYLLDSLVQKVKDLEAEAEVNRAQLAQQKYRANHDALTGLPNRYAFEDRFALELQRFVRFDRPSVLAIFDIDHFKAINDEHGHTAGDRVIKVIGNLIAKRLRKVDFFGRYGGEEFVAILPETDIHQAERLLNKIREAIAKLAFNYKERSLRITISIGATSFLKDDSQSALFERADAALYSAKHEGRNCVKIN